MLINLFFQTTVSSLDTSTVKSKCRLSLNLNRESSDYCRPSTSSNTSSTLSETLHIKSQRDSHRKLELTEVTLSSELFLAPEMMYASLDLPGMVVECTKDLPDYVLKECFSNILLTGMRFFPFVVDIRKIWKFKRKKNVQKYSKSLWYMFSRASE